jgi:hypothetical protein
MIPSASEYGVLEDEVELHSRGPVSSLSPITLKQKLYLLGMQGLGSGVVNVAVNLLVAFLMYRHLPHNAVPWAGSMTCVVSDVLVTAFLIPCLTAIIATPLIRFDLRAAKLVTPVDSRYLSLPLFKYIPTGQSWREVLKRAVLFGFVGVAAFAPVTLLIIYACTGTRGMRAMWDYVAFKGYWGGLEAAILSPVLAFITVAQRQPAHLVGSRVDKQGLAYAPAYDHDTATDDEGDATKHAAGQINGGMGRIIAGGGTAGDNNGLPGTAPSYIVT